ncbi:MULTISPECIES: YitT family protein [Fictibacillus]|uniref:YitT family protein n=1 Tax=Fictibacillus TaxID=1329200 RepID=UPI0018CF15DB|nr:MULTISPECIES: YitT family protein [unclassified Fictibacillus]MBH0154763.1 YitT family protein [Fictibacillus sp. 5RED26]MBH0162693.1 YitT family protein [Fictibacillus sp. 26RED30]MBH0165454.1 YitT family protein [Fictibacillus sp. 7GRE50]MBH0171952.1 YitT family protein [Fictibacillus sp. 23RED33]
MFERTIAIFLGSVLLGIGINGFIVPFHLLDGGMIGISLLVKYVWGYKVGLTIIILSIPIYLIAWKLERRYFINSIHGLLVSSLIIDLLSPLRGMFSVSVMEGSVIGGLFIGTGIGWMLRHETSTGGTDLIALFLSRWFSINVGMVIFLIDAAVILAGLYVMGEGILFYSLVTILSVGFATMTMTLIRSINFYRSI